MSQNIKNKLRPKRKRKLVEPNTPQDNAGINEPKNKRIKLSEEKDVESKAAASTKPDLTVDLSAFSNLPTEIIYHHIVIFIPLEWLYVSKYLHKIAVQNLDQDPRIKWDEQSFKRALKVDNVTAIIKHLSMTKFRDSFLQIQFKSTVHDGCVRVFEYLFNHNSILKLDPLEPEYTYTYITLLLDAVIKGYNDVVALLLSSGRCA